MNQNTQFVLKHADFHNGYTQYDMAKMMPIPMEILLAFPWENAYFVL